VQLGPEALALGAHLNKQVGLSLGQTTQVLQLGFGLQVSRAGIYRALARMAAKAAPTYEQLIGTARQSLVNGMDETGWRVGGRSQWLWVAVSEEVTVYAILPGRGFEEAASILGAGLSGAFDAPVPRPAGRQFGGSGRLPPTGEKLVAASSAAAGPA
jgi:transposase